MWKNFDDFSEKDISRLLSGKEAMALAAILGQMDSDLLNRAANAAAQGNTAAAQQLLTPLMQDPKVRELLKKMEENNGGI